MFSGWNNVLNRQKDGTPFTFPTKPDAKKTPFCSFHEILLSCFGNFYSHHRFSQPGPQTAVDCVPGASAGSGRAAAQRATAPHVFRVPLPFPLGCSSNRPQGGAPLCGGILFDIFGNGQISPVVCSLCTLFHAALPTMLQTYTCASLLFVHSAQICI